MDFENEKSTAMPDKVSPGPFVYDTEVTWEPAGEGVRRKVMAWDETLMLVRVEFIEGAVGVLHEHHHSQISHIESGRFEVEISGQKQVLAAGDVYIVPSHAVHGCVCIEPGVLIDAFSPKRDDFVSGT